MKLKLLGLVLALQAMWVLGTAFVHEQRLQSPTVLLETRPVDPRDLLRGDYVILNYEISDIELTKFAPPLSSAPPEGTPVFVALEKRGEFHRVASASLNAITPAPNQVVIRGHVGSRWGRPGGVRVEYGLERYYVPEGTGNPRGKLTVRAAVSKTGESLIKEVYVDGKPYGQVMKGEVHR
jgi:uncharacterized membrane-anchored protein